MYYSTHGNSDLPVIILLHGAFFVDAFGRQYPLSDRYHMVVPHLKGFGKAANETFETEAAVNELKEFISQYEKPVYLIGFSLGAQLGFKLLSESPKLFKKAILVSPFLTDKEAAEDEMLDENLKMLRSMKSKFKCNLIGRMNGLPKQAREEFVESMQLVSEETVLNCVKNGISFDTCGGFSSCDVPVLALAGGKEHLAVQNSVKHMAEINPNCRYQIWDKAKHNIPPVFAKKFNETILSFFDGD